MIKFFVVLISVFLFSCQEIKTEYSPVLQENASVVAKIYTPSRHETSIEPSLGSSSGIGIGYSGNVGIGIGHGMVITSNTVPEVYGAVFQCQHGVFTSQGSDARHRALYEKLQAGQKVIVLYKEIYTATYDDINKDDKNELKERVLTSFDFLDANPVVVEKQAAAQ